MSINDTATEEVFPDSITPNLLLLAYMHGVFPMAESRHDPEIGWLEPHMRGILPIETFHVSKSLQKKIRQQVFDVTFDQDFEGVIRACADSRDTTWINDTIIDLYVETHKQGYAHSVEVRDRDTQELVGGVYGISINGAFFGESMFSTRTDASKIALTYLVARLWRQGFTLLDAQFVNPHLVQFGCVEISQEEYKARLAVALNLNVSFDQSTVADGGGVSSGKSASAASGVAGAAGLAGAGSNTGFSDVSAFLQSINHTS